MVKSKKEVHESGKAHILTEEETHRLQILRDNFAIRREIEKEFWQVLSYPKSKLDASFSPAPCHEIWKGEIMPLLKWSMGNDGKFDFDSFKKYSRLFDAVFAGDCEANIDNVRRALLAFGIDKYPRCFRGNTNLSFVCDPKLLAKCVQKNIQKPNSLFIILLQGARMSGKYWIMIENELLQDLDEFSSWKMWKDECAYCDHKVYDVALDILPAESKAKCQLRVFNRNNNSGKKLFDVKSMSEKMGLSYRNDDGRFYSNVLSFNEMEQFLNDIVDNIKQQQDIET